MPSSPVRRAVAFADLAPYLEATALGFLVGFERDWSSRRSEQQAAGVRTFAVVALAGAAASAIGPTVVAGGALAVGSILAVGYLRTAHADLGVTTETAALATYLLGALVHDHAAIAVGAAIVMATVLVAKVPLHQISRQLVSEVELQDALRFLVAAFVVLPFVPDRHLGPYGALNPWRIWLLVVLVSGIGWAGYIAVRALGSRRGLPITGFAGGFVSAAAATASLARIAKERPAIAASALAGVLLASAATLIQLLVVLSVASPRVLASLAPACAVGVVLLLAEFGLLLWRGENALNAQSSTPTAVDTAQTRPFRLGPAVVLAASLTAITLVARWAASIAGPNGAVGAAALAGFADAHAPSLAVATLASTHAVTVRTALLATGCALATNSLTKVVLATAAGGRRFGLYFAGAMTLPIVGTGGVLAYTLT